jgi:uncharacterized ParB-like nuclease family protein
VPDNISLDLIRIDGGTQPRASTREQTVEEYAAAAAAGDEFPDLVVFHDGKDYWLADGFHRLLGYRKAGKESAPCKVKPGTVRDARLYAAGCNHAHGLRRSTEDKRAAVLLLLADEEWARASDRWIAEKCKVSNHFAGAVRKEHQPAATEKKVVATGNIPTSNNQASPKEEEKRVGQDGKTYPATKPLVLCGRCKRAAPRTGIEGCNACKELRGEKTTPAPETNGAPPKKAAKKPKPPAEPEPAPEPEDAPEPQPALPSLDAVNVPIPEQSLEAFALLDKFKEALRLHRELSRVIDLLAQSPGGECFRHAACGLKESGGKQTFFSDKLHTLAYDFKGNQPHAALCPYCIATGANHNLKTCSACHGLPYVPKTLWSQAPDDYRQAVLALAVKGVNA